MHHLPHVPTFTPCTFSLNQCDESMMVTRQSDTSQCAIPNILNVITFSKKAIQLLHKVCEVRHTQFYIVTLTGTAFV